MLMRENEQLVQNRKKNSQAKLDVYKHKTTIRKKECVECVLLCLLSCTMDTVHADLCPHYVVIVPELMCDESKTKPRSNRERD